ncbi:MAG TPA: thioredoxin family protein [Syntrophales bacterium]|nr:thioredoxin family protein [Syntrophales bacterium]
MKMKRSPDDDHVIIECPRCGTKNRLPRARINDKPRCGKCHAPLSVESYTVKPLETSDGTFAHDILAAVEPALVYFYSPTCPYCRMLSPVIDQMAVKFEGAALVARIDVTANPAMSAKYGIQGVPTLLLFREGKLLKRMVGVLSGDEIERNLKGIIRTS